MPSAERSREGEYRSHILQSARYTRRAERAHASASAASAPQQATPSERAAVSQSPGMFSSVVGIMLAIFMFVATCGLMFLSGYERMAVETYHTGELQKVLKQTEALNQILRQQDAVAITESSIGQKAALLGMTPVNEETAVNLGDGMQHGNQVFASAAVR